MIRPEVKAQLNGIKTFQQAEANGKAIRAAVKRGESVLTNIGGETVTLSDEEVRYMLGSLRKIYARKRIRYLKAIIRRAYDEEEHGCADEIAENIEREIANLEKVLEA